jgi:hypothetical protein
VKQKLAASFGVMGPEAGGVDVGGDVDAEQPGLVVLDPGVGVGQGDAPGAQ